MNETKSIILTSMGYLPVAAYYAEQAKRLMQADKVYHEIINLLSHIAKRRHLEVKLIDMIKKPANLMLRLFNSNYKLTISSR